MKIIKPSVEFLGAAPTDYAGAVKFIEMAGRTCYKSESKGEPEKFVRKLITSEHLAMVEHSNFVVRRPWSILLKTPKIGKYLSVLSVSKKFLYVGGNLTAWYQCSEKCIGELFSPFINTFGNLFQIGEDIEPQYWQVCPHDEIPKELHRYSIKFICDRGVSHELVRHRLCSFAQESTRYVNYGDKDMEFIEPVGFEDWQHEVKEQFKWCCKDEEWRYNRIIGAGLKPQQARAVLPNALKTEIIVTADTAEWRHIKNLRTSKAAHPDMQRVMNMIPWEEFLND